MVEVRAKAPKDCSPAELAAFEQLVLEGGEVDPVGLTGRIKRATALAFLITDQGLMGVAGLKQPGADYRAKVAGGSGTALAEDRYPLELGWVYVREGVRGGKSKMLCDSLIPHAEGRGMFATSRANNPWMHATLAKEGFERAGGEWPSGQNPAKLFLFLRQPEAQELSAG